VRTLQASLNELGERLEVDGHFGPLTMAAVRRYARAKLESSIPEWLLDIIHAEAATLHRERRNALGGISTVGAWCGASTLANPKRDVDFAVAHGINRLDIVVNDHAAWREPKPFTVRSRKRIRALVERAERAGIETHLMSWIMPHREYIEAAAEKLVPLCNDLGVASLQWDAEEPWMRAKGGMGCTLAAELVAERFADLRCPMGVTGIGYADHRKLGPLAKHCAYVVPQCYATAKSGQTPEEAPGRFHELWHARFERPVVIGLAAYRQAGIEGHTPRSAIETAAKAAAATGVDTVVYWSLGAMRRSPVVAQAIKEIRLPPV
jgi:hypothetical protein